MFGFICYVAELERMDGWEIKKGGGTTERQDDRRFGCSSFTKRRMHDK